LLMAKSTPILKALFDVNHSIHLLRIHILTNKMGQLKSNKTDYKPHFILHTNCFMLQHQVSIFTGFIKNKGYYVQQVLQVPAALTFILKVLKCYNFKLQMLTSTAHIAVIATPYSNGPLLSYYPSCLCSPACVYKHLWQYMIQCDLVQLKHTTYLCVKIYSVLLLHLLLINICWILIYFGKLFFFWYKSYYFLLICISVHCNYRSTFIWFCFY
jgi:hypothetical protein